MNRYSLILMMIVSLVTGCSTSKDHRPAKLITYPDANSAFITIYLSNSTDAAGQKLIVQKDNKVTNRIPIDFQTEIQWMDAPTKVAAVTLGRLSEVDLSTGQQKFILDINSIIPSAGNSSFEWNIVNGNYLLIFCTESRQIWSVELPNKVPKLILDRAGFNKLFSQSDQKSSTGYISDIRINKNRDKIAISVRGEKLLYEQAHDYEADCYVFYPGSKKAVKIGKGEPIDWIDDTHVLVWNIEKDKLVSTVFSEEGNEVFRRLGDGIIVWTGERLASIPIDIKSLSAPLISAIVNFIDYRLNKVTGSLCLVDSYIGDRNNSFLVYESQIRQELTSGTIEREN